MNYCDGVGQKGLVDCDPEHGQCDICIIDRLEAENESMKAELESLRKDAERYRFLMQSEISDDHSPTAGFYVIYEDGRWFGDLLCGEEASEAIDAAISSPENNNER